MKKAKEGTFKAWVQELKHDPVSAIQKTKGVYHNREERECGDAFIRSLVGGPSEATTWPVYNALGQVYPTLSRSLKDQVLEQLLGIFDGINWAYVNGERGVGHTTGIREPLLLADIGIVRSVYWPGLDEGKRRVRKYSCFRDLEQDLMTSKGMFQNEKVASDFVVGYSLLRSDFCKYGEEYVSAVEPQFLERTLRGIVALRFGVKGADVKKGMSRLYELLPESVHERLKPLRQEGGWANYARFQ